MYKILDSIPVNTTLENVLESLRIEEEEDVEIVSSLFENAKAIAKPKVLYKEVFVEEINGNVVRIDGFDFVSKVLASVFNDVDRIFAHVCTCGTEVDDWSRTESDYISSLWLEFIKGMFLGEAAVYFSDHLKSTYGFEHLSKVSPGSGNLENWPISQQAQLFGLLDNVKEKIGVTLTDSFLMIPIKSMSGLLFTSAKAYSDCSLCNQENCPSRSVEFNHELHDKVFA